jgi:hypothetical protein
MMPLESLVGRDKREDLDAAYPDEEPRAGTDQGAILAFIAFLLYSTVAWTVGTVIIVRWVWGRFSG